MNLGTGSSGQAPDIQRPTRLFLRLYVAGRAPNSLLALANLQQICDRYFPGITEWEIVDVMEEPWRAIRDGVVVTPMLLRLTPPIRRIVGNLSDTEKVLRALDLHGGVS